MLSQNKIVYIGSTDSNLKSWNIAVKQEHISLEGQAQGQCTAPKASFYGDTHFSQQ